MRAGNFSPGTGNRHSSAVYNYLYRRTADWSAAEDLTAAVFLQAWRRRNEVVLDRDSALPWLLGVARLQLRNATRSRERYLAALSRAGHEAAAEASPADPADVVAHRLDDAQQVRALRTAIARLPRQGGIVNPIDELASLLPASPPSRDLPRRDQHEADLLAVIAADRAAGTLQSSRQWASWPLSSWRGAAGGRWLAPSAAAVAVAAAVIIVAIVTVAVPRLTDSGARPGSQSAGHPTAGSSGAPAGSPLTATRHWSVPAAAIGTIVATSDNGAVVVTGAATSTASVTAIPTYHGEPPTISSHVSAGTLTVTASCPPGEQNCWVTLQLTVPSREHVVADSGPSDVRLAGLSGGGTATADQGNVSLSRVSGGMTAIAGQGDIDANRIGGTLTARADQGDIDVTSLTGRLAAHAGQGNITLTGIAGTLTAQADQGSITASGLAVRQATLTSGQSTIDATFSQPPALVVANCQMGSVTLRLPGNSSYAVTASAQMGSTFVHVPQSAGSPHVVKATSQMGSVTVTR